MSNNQVLDRSGNRTDRATTAWSCAGFVGRGLARTGDVQSLALSVCPDGSAWALWGHTRGTSQTDMREGKRGRETTANIKRRARRERR